MSKEERDKYLQITAAQTAIALGGSIPAAGPGKSIQKYFLSQADSDFIFSILVEEYSVVGGAFILLLFAVFAVRVTVQALRVEDLFGLLVLCGLLCVIMCQAVVHTGVNVGMLPVTGQNLPFISSGGTSIIASCLMVGIMQKIIMNAREKRRSPRFPLRRLPIPGRSSRRPPRRKKKTTSRRRMPPRNKRGRRRLDKYSKIYDIAQKTLSDHLERRRHRRTYIPGGIHCRRIAPETSRCRHPVRGGAGAHGNDARARSRIPHRGGCPLRASSVRSPCRIWRFPSR